MSKQHAHIKDQLHLIDTGLAKFKALALQTAVLEQAKKVIGSSKYTGEDSVPDEESGNSGARLQENLLAPAFAFMGGIIDVKDIAKFKRLIIRSTRAQVLVNDFPLILPDTERIVGDRFDENKRVLILAYQDGAAIQGKLKRVIAAFEGEFHAIKPDSLVDEKG